MHKEREKINPKPLTLTIMCPVPRWIDRCIKAHSRPSEQNLFAIIQGGLDPELRKISLEQLVARDTPGYAIGGLAGGESKDDFWSVPLNLSYPYEPADCSLTSSLYFQEDGGN